MRKYGGFVPGIRPGRKTAEYIDRVLSRITLPGAIFLARDRRPPGHDPRPLQGSGARFGGTSVLIVVGVALDTLQQVESHLLMRHYEGFVKRAAFAAVSECSHESRAARPARSRQGHAGPKARQPSAGWALISTGDMLRDAVAKQTPLGLQARQLMDAGSWCPTKLMIGWCASGRSSPTPAAGSCSTGSRAPCRRRTRWTRCWRSGRWS